MVEKLIGLYPAIDTLVPMLRSFEGVVDCQVTATWQGGFHHVAETSFPALSLLSAWGKHGAAGR